MDNTKIRIDTTDDKEYKGKPFDFFLCHSPLIKNSSNEEVEYVLQNEWPFAMFQVLKFKDSNEASHFSVTAPGNNAPCLQIGNVVLRMCSALANVNAPHTKLTPEEVAHHLSNIIPKAAHWYRCVVLNK